MTYFPMLAATVLVLAQTAPTEAPPPLSQEQLTKLRSLVKTTQETAADLQKKLEDKQRELASLYEEYELRERLAFKLEADIVDLQKQLLANHHKMQSELRTIVGKERFEVLKNRLKNVFPPKIP